MIFYGLRVGSGRLGSLELAGPAPVSAPHPTHRVSAAPKAPMADLDCGRLARAKTPRWHPALTWGPGHGLRMGAAVPKLVCVCVSSLRVVAAIPALVRACVHTSTSLLEFSSLRSGAAIPIRVCFCACHKCSMSAAGSAPLNGGGKTNIFPFSDFLFSDFFV